MLKKRQRLPAPVPAKGFLDQPVLGIHEILVRIRIRTSD